MNDIWCSLRLAWNTSIETVDVDPETPATSLKPEWFSSRYAIHEGRLAVTGPLWEFNPRFTWDLFLTAYRRNPVEALINLASYPPTKSRIKFYTDIERVRMLVDKSRKGHPIREDLSFENWFRPRPMASYTMHFDLSEVKDPTACALAHWCHQSQRVYLDFALEIQPTPGNPVRLKSMENLVLALLDRGFDIRQVTMDLWGSAALRQTLESRGIVAMQYSVDRTTEAHETLHHAIHTGLLSFYPYEPLLVCLDDLYWSKGGRKIDHRPGGKKDVADAAAGAVLWALKLEGFKEVPDIEVLSLERTPSDDEDLTNDDLLELRPIPKTSRKPGENPEGDEYYVEGDDMDEVDTLDEDDDGLAY
ncbi:MAG: hypothetical protein UY48_C0003G0012 [Candidatus Gottesmanbacteria bacterium GW2011_GWB1_49_7]|uniref:Terminase large subunit gp17-like C-terminal domain-containing protein n=1 Tax=Candidatus Gottesmanbacteria bacterium GW2011_GWB1_49_7 TaxID=1618448 RepID=A0A0G1W3Q2_9BACT|nr:MAG: hypothetical protein UY48_C0003G0012 [Candidatus Gottesmanbacteria bacterium GW2011_GWB1_49_7]